MADYLSPSAPGNFSNPAYASPEQLKAQRDYAAELLKRSTEGATRPTGVAAAMIDALTSNIYRNNADRLQSQAAQGNAADVAAIAAQLQGGQPLNPQTMGHLYANPMASPEARGLVQHLIEPQSITSGYGQPAYQSPSQGVVAPPIRGNYIPSAPISQSVEGASQTGPAPAPGAAMPRGGAFGGMSKPVGWGQGQTPPPAPAPGEGNAFGGYQGPMTLDQLAAKGRNLSAQKAMSEAQTGVAKQDFSAASTAPDIKRVAGIMLDDINAHGDKMTFGPTAEWSNNIKKIAANYAPGAVKDQLTSIASADSFDKMSAQLTSMLSKSGGTDAQLFNNMKSVPGSHNSKEGAVALLKMTMQVADQQQALRETTRGKVGDQYEIARNEFLARNPIINPLTRNPIKLDLEKEKTNTGSGGFKILKVHPQ